MKLVNEVTKEKAERVIIESSLDVKKKRLTQAIKEITKMKQENTKLKEEKSNILNTLKKYMCIKKGNEEVIKTLTDSNTNLNNENKKLNKLYEEKNKKEKI